MTKTYLKSKIEKAIKALTLNLNGYTVLTEAATGPYSMTAIIAAFAGAQVYAFAQTTSYGTIKKVFYEMQQKINSLGCPPIQLIDTLSPKIISEADIITNSGHLRPLDQDKLQYLKKGAVASLMYEDWEIRDIDIDINCCNRQNIVVGAINERHQNVDVFSYLGDMAIKQIFDAGLTPCNNRFILICNNEFGPYIARRLKHLCQLGVIDKEENRGLYGEGIDWLSSFPEVDIPAAYAESEAVIFSAYPWDKIWIGNNGPIQIPDLASQLVRPFILRFAGDVDTVALKTSDIGYFPEYVKSGHMGILPSEIGYDPIIRLQAGGLKVGELLLKNKTHYKNELICRIVK